MRACCKKPENLQEAERTADRVVQVCTICHAKHVHFLAEAGQLFGET